MVKNNLVWFDQIKSYLFEIGLVWLSLVWFGLAKFFFGMVNPESNKLIKMIIEFNISL